VSTTAGTQAQTVEQLLALGKRCFERDELDRADAAFRQVLEREPGQVRAIHNLGRVAYKRGQLEEAERRYRRTIELAPQLAEPYANLGWLCKELARLGEAETCYRRAIERRPDFAEAHAYLALVLLQQGRWREGWEEYEWRWHLPDWEKPQEGVEWDGSDPSGRTLLVHDEQGLGDAVQFVRYASLLAARGARVVIECQPELARMLRGARDVAEVIARGARRPAFDARVPMVSLPRLLGTDPSSIPGGVPYLRPDPALARTWRARLDRWPGPRVGLLWGGNPRNRDDRNRSLRLETLGPLLRIPGISFFSLQVGARAGELEAAPRTAAVIDLAPQLGDFAHTAAAVYALDLVVSVDTAVLHVAGALGRPAWLLLSSSPDWRWLMDRPDTAWYPSVRLYRQEQRGDWGPVVARLRRDLEAFIRGYTGTTGGAG